MTARPTTKSDDAPVLRSPSLVGRERELAALTAALARPPAVVLVEGEAGIGKSRLVREFLASPTAGRHAVIASCPPFREPFTLGPIVDALRQVTDRIVDLRLTALAGALRPLFPEWADELPPPPEPLVDATAAHHRLLRALGELLDRLGLRVLVVEDVHWADEATMEFLLFLASRQSQHLSVVVTYRPEDVPSGSLLLRLSSRVPVGTTQLRITLDPLDVVETAQFVSSMLAGGHVSEEFARYLHEHTDGLPLAIEETVRLLRDRRDMRRRGGEWVRRALDQLAVPATFRDAVLERYARLSVSAQRVLRAAAVLTDPFDEPMLLSVIDLGDDEVGLGLAEALASGLIAESDRGLMAYRHALACRVVYDAIPAPERRRIHLHAGDVIEGLDPLPVPQLARHFREAGETKKWCKYAEKAAEMAASAGDDTTGIALLNDLLVTAGLSARTRARLAKKLAIAAVTRRSASSGLVMQTMHIIRAVLDAPDLTLQEKAEIRSPLGHLLLQLGDFDAARAELELAIPGLEHSPVEAARSMIYLGMPRAGSWPVDVHLEWLRRAAELPTGSFPPADRLALAIERATALLLLGEEAGWTLASETATEVAAENDSLLATRCAVNTGVLAIMWGRYRDAKQRLSVALELADIERYPRIRSSILASRAHVDWLTGEWDGLAERAASLVDTDDAQPVDQLEATLVTGLLDTVAGDSRAAGEKFRLVLDKLGRGGPLDLSMHPAAALAQLYLKDGHIDEALALTDEPMRVIAGKRIWLWATEMAPARLQALVMADRHEEAARLVAAFAHGLGGRSAPAPRAALATCGAILLEGQGKWGRAAAFFDRAAAAWQALPRPYDALLAGERQGYCLLRHDRDAGVAVLTEVLRGLSALGALSDADRVARSLREHGVKTRRVWRGGRRGYGDRLSPRELEVVRLVVSGRTNREIAKALFRSPKTVDTQLNSAMRKLGVSSRTALAVSVIEAGILPVDQTTVER